MGTIARLNTAKKKLAQAEQAMPGAYQNNYTDSINQKLVQLADASLTGSTGVDTDALNAAYQQYRANSVANAQNGAAAAAGTANTLAGGYGADWAKTAANQAAGEQIAGVDNSLSSLRADALQNWKQKMSDTTSVLDDLLGQQSLERSEYDGSVSNAQNWRDYLSGRVDTARQENSDFWNNVWNVVKGVGNAVKTGYDAYQGYYQWDKEFELQKQQYADSLQRTQLSDQISAMEQAQAFKQAGFDDLAAQTLTKYGLDSTMLDAWEGMSDTQKDKMAALLQGASLAGSGNDTAAKNYLQMAGLSGDSTDSYGTIAGRLNSSKLAYQQALLGLQQRYKTTGTGSTRSGGSSSGSKSGGYTTSQLQQMANKFSSMKGTEPLYDFYKRTLTNAGWIKADTGTKASTQSAAGGTGAGKAGTTTSKLPAATTKTPWSTSGTVDGVAGASVSMASPKGGNYNTALREAQQMANNGYDMAQITEYLIRKNYSDSTISQVSQTMGWSWRSNMSRSVEQVRQMREQIKANDAAKTAAQKKTTTQTAKTTPAAPAAKSAGTGLSVAQVAQIRSQMTAAPASTSRLQTTASTPAWTGGTRQVLGTVSADALGKQVLADMTSDTGSPVATDRQEDYEPDWNYVGSDNAPKQRAIAQGTYGSYAKAAQKVGNALAKDRQTDRFDELNQWMDESPRHREVVDLLRQKEYTTQEDKGVAPEQAVQVTGTKQRYSPGDLLKMGYTAQEINEARAYIREYDALPVTDRAVRRTADTTKGIAATVASAVPMAGEMTTQGVKDIRATQKNEAALDKELEGDARGKELKDRITAVDMDYNPQYTDEDLRGMGYSQSEIDEMRSRIAGTVQKTALDKDTSLGYQLYNYGQQRTAAAQAGLSPAAKTAMGVATSAAENLAVAGVSPYLVLPVLSAQGAAESMGQDVEKGTSVGQAVGVGLAKFGAGWAINSVGVADMARSMGVDYARDTVAGKLADLVRSSKLVSGLGNSQLAANTISGGVDNAVQAFVETYADKIIDATLGGDQQAADELLQSDTFLQALQSGLTGGASGALGGAVGTGLGAMSRTLDARAGTETAAPVQADTESRAADAAAAQRALEARAMEPGEAARQQADQAAAVQQTDNADAAETTAQKDAASAVRSENPAVQQLAAALQADNLTGKTINLFTPNAANEANRAAFAEEYGMELPATASETRKALRTLAQQQTAEQALREES